MVDLKETPEGLFFLRNGEQGYTQAIEDTDGKFLVRYESGWYCEYRRDGTRIRAGYIYHHDGSIEEVKGDNGRDIVKVEVRQWERWMQGGFPP